MAFLDELRRRFRQTPGYAGGTLEDQLARDASRWDVNAGSQGGPLQSPNDQILTDRNREAITRPRTVTEPVPAEMATPPEATRPRIAQPSFKDALMRQRAAPEMQAEPFGSTGEPFGARPRRTQPRDYIADNAQYLRDLESEPHNWKDKVVDVADAISVGLGNAPRKTMTKREREIARTANQIGTDLRLRNEQAKFEQDQLVPVVLENGEQVMVPRNSAGSLRSRQQEIGIRDDRLTAQQRRWDAMSSRDRKRELRALYVSGALNTPEGLQYAAKELDIPVDLLPKFISGQMRDAIDEEGNIIEVNRQTGDVVPTGEQSYEVTKEAGRDRRVSAGVASREKIAGMPARSSGRGAVGTPKVDRVTQRRAAGLIGQIDRARREMEYADAKGDKKARENARMIGTQAATELNALNAGYEAGPGEKGYPYYKKSEAAPQGQQGGQYAGRRISQANVLKYAERHKMSPEEAAAYLQNAGATIY